MTIPLLLASVVLTQLDFDIVWRYFSWSNQTLSVITLWAEAMYLVRNAEKRWYSLMCALPAAFMSAVSCTYILMADEGFKIPSNIIGLLFAAACFSLYTVKCEKSKRESK